MSLTKLADGIYVDSSKIEYIKKLDSLVFDCDGVLIDVSNSYDLAIKKTVDFIVNKMASIDQSKLVTTKMIDSFKATGGFNDEVDVTYSLILSVIAAKKLNKPFDKFVFEVAKNANQTGIISVENFLKTLDVDISDMKNKLSYPGNKFESQLSSIFDELFYGSELYLHLYKRKPEFFHGKGLIENDVLLVKKKLMEELHKRFDRRISIVTGRGILSTKHSLGDLFDEFDSNNSKFLEDQPREMAKPNPQSLISSIKGMGGTCSIFVGDSIEDYLMANHASRLGIQTIFCGIYGTSKEPGIKCSLFEKRGADLIVESVDLIPKTLNLVGA